MDELRLPPAPPAGDDVRARVLARVLDGLDQAPPRRDRHWLVPVAAAVAGVLVVGAAVLVGGGRGGSVPSAGSTNPTVRLLMTPDPGPRAFGPPDENARCADAARRSPGTYPDPAAWSYGGGIFDGAEGVMVVTPGVLCRTTPTSVFLSPVHSASDPTASVVDLGLGSVGVLGPAGTTMTVDLGSGTPLAVQPLAGDSTTFVLGLPVDADWSRAVLTVTAPGQAPRAVTVSSAEPGLSVVDRPTPPQERSSTDAILLDRCLVTPAPSPPLSALAATVPDPDAFTALPRLTLPDGTVAVPASAPGTAALCVSHGSRVSLAVLTGTSSASGVSTSLHGTTESSATVEITTGTLVVDTDSVLDDTLGGAHVAVLSVDPSTTSVEARPGPDAPVACRLHDSVAYCLYRAGGGPTVFSARAADGSVTGTATP